MAEEIKAWRGRVGLTQAQAAEAIGVKLRWYQALEAGGWREQAAEPTLTQRLAMAAVEAGLQPLGDRIEGGS